MIVEIFWDDSTRANGWCDPDELSGKEKTSCTSIGYVVSEDDETITISTSYHRNSKQFIDPLTIPKCAITGMWEYQGAIGVLSESKKRRVHKHRTKRRK